MQNLPRFMADHFLLLLGSLILLMTMALHAEDITFPVLRTGTMVYSNVTVYGRSKTDLYIRHSQGLGNIKLADLDNATLASLVSIDPNHTPITKGATTIAADGTATATEPAKKPFKFEFKLPAILIAKARALNAPAGVSSANGGTVLAVAAVVFSVVYLLVCICFKKICENAGTKPGALIWVPIAQWVPLLKAAGMPAWWLVVLLIPVLNCVALIVWSFNIVKACGKQVWVALALILPVTNVFAFLYLAFSGKGGSSASQGGKIGLRPVEVA